MRYIVFFLPFFSLLSAPVFNPSCPSILQKGIFLENAPVSIRSGYEGNFVFDRRLEQYRNAEGRVDNYEVYVNAGNISLDFFEVFSLFGNLGSGKIESDFRLQSEGIEKRAVTKSDEEFSWGLGLNTLLFSWEKLKLGAGFRYTTFDPKLYFFSLDGVVYDSEQKRFHFREWQCNLGLSYKIDFLTPYIGAKYTYAKSKIRLPEIEDILEGKDTQRFFRSRQDVGLYLGCTIAADRAFLISIESRLIDEEAVSVFAEFRL